jgi:hypothetical protein
MFLDYNPMETGKNNRLMHGFGALIRALSAILP